VEGECLIVLSILRGVYGCVPDDLCLAYSHPLTTKRQEESQKEFQGMTLLQLLEFMR